MFMESFLDLFALQVFCPTRELGAGWADSSKAEKAGMDLLKGTEIVELFKSCFDYSLTRMSRASSALCQLLAMDFGCILY